MTKFMNLFFALLFFITSTASLIYSGSALAASEKVLRFPLILDPETLDPAKSSDIYSLTVIQQIFDGLVQYDEHLNITPAIAESWKISMDGKVYTFSLRKGVKFHNGRQVTPNDVVFSLKRILDPKNPSPFFSHFQVISGAKEYHDGLANQINGLKVLDKYTVEITLSEPYSPFIYLLGMVAAKIVPKQEVENLGKNFQRAPLGTGPFKFVSWTQQKEIVLRPNTDYLEGPPGIDRLIFKIYGSTLSQEIYNDFISNNVDSFEVPPRWTEELPKTIKYERLKRPILGFYFYALNNNKPFLRQRNVRLAFNYAIEKEKFIGKFIAANKIIPPGMLGYDPSAQGYSYDISKAKQLMQGIEPETIEILSVVKSEMAVRELNKVKENLESIGVNVRISFAENWEAFMGRIRKNDFDVYRYSWLADFPDPDNFIGILFHSASEFNMFNYKNPELDKLLIQGNREIDMLKRAEIYRKAEKLILDDAPIVPIGFYAQEIIVKPYVKNLRLGPLGSPYIPFKKVIVEDH